MTSHLALQHYVALPEFWDQRSFYCMILELCVNGKRFLNKKLTRYSGVAEPEESG